MAISNLKFALKHSCKTTAQIHQVHAQAITSGVFSLYTSSLLTHILHSFPFSSTHQNVNGGFIYITNIFNRIPNPSNFNYNDIIRAHTLLRSPHTALILFLEMRRRQIEPNSHTFPSVLKACGLLQNSNSLARVLHAQVTKFGFLDDVYVRNALSCTYCRSGDVDGAKRVFEESSFRNVVSYTVIIDGLFKVGEINHARELFDEMPSSLRNVVSYNVMIDGLVRGGEIDNARKLFEEMPSLFRDGMSYTIMIDGLFKGGEIDHARELFEEMPSSLRDVVSYNAMIDGLFKGGEIDRARELFEEMPRSLRNVMTHNAMIDGLFKAGEIDHAKDLFDEMPFSLKDVVSYNAMIDGLFKGGEIARARELFVEMSSSFRNGVSYTAMIDGLFKAGEIDQAKELFDEMPSSCREENVALWNAMLMGLATHGHGGSVLRYFSRMLKDGVKPNGVTILAVLVGCNHSGLIYDANKISVKMESVYSVPREAKHYRCMVDILARAGLIKEAREMIEAMSIGGDEVVWRALLGGCKKHGVVEEAEEAAEHLMRMKPEEGAVYSSLAHIYANSERWDDVVRVRRLKDSRRIKQFRGCSWIVLDGIKYDFLQEIGRILARKRYIWS